MLTFNDKTTNSILTFPKGALYNWICSIYTYSKNNIYINYIIYLSHWPFSLEGSPCHTVGRRHLGATFEADAWTW